MKTNELTPRRSVKLLLVSQTVADLEQSKIRIRDVDEAAEIMGLNDFYFEGII